VGPYRGTASFIMPEDSTSIIQCHYLTRSSSRCLDFSYHWLFVPRTIRTLCRPFVPWTIRFMDLSYHWLFVLWTSYHRPFVPFIYFVV